MYFGSLFGILFRGGGLNAAGRFQRPVTIAHRSDVPASRRRIVFQLKRLVIRYLVLVGSNINSYIAQFNQIIKKLKIKIKIKKD